MVNTIPSSHVYQGPSCHSFLQLDTLGFCFYLFVSAIMQDHQRCVVSARLGFVAVSIVLSIGLLVLQSVREFPGDRTKKVNKAVSLQVTDSQSPLMVCQRSNKVCSTTNSEKLAPLNRDIKRIMKEDMIKHYLSSFANLFQIKPYLLRIILICIDFVKPCMINWGSITFTTL